MPYARIVVTFDDGKQNEIIAAYKPGTLDATAHRFQDSEQRFWGTFKRTTGVQYQALNATTGIDAIIEAHKLAS
jgi:hypothetical protein